MGTVENGLFFALTGAGGIVAATGLLDDRGTSGNFSWITRSIQI